MSAVSCGHTPKLTRHAKQRQAIFSHIAKNIFHPSARPSARPANAAYLRYPSFKYVPMPMAGPMRSRAREPMREAHREARSAAQRGRDLPTLGTPST